jgi:BirA family biotin operon repressor/biotin-[acetyl-CoA-carboxylase] ligase
VDAAHLGTRFVVRHLEETTSTNTVALEAAAAGEPEGLVVVADHQRAGRGRLGRAWVAPAGSALLVSVLLRPRSASPHLVVTAVGCAAAAACGGVSGYEPGLKWPNDLVAGDRKLGGILAEATATAGNVTALVVGLGLNLRSVPRPPELEATATDLEHLSTTVVERDVLLGALLEELEPRYAQLEREGPSALLEEYRSRCVTIGQQVRVEQPGGVVEGLAVGVGEDGTLELERGLGGRVRVDVGDVIHLRSR